MNVTVFGATGAIGQLIVDQLLRQGENVTAYARNAAKVPGRWDGSVNVVIGAITDVTAIDAAVAGADAVVSALGPSMDRNATGLPLVDGTRLIVASMKRHGIRRYVGNGTPSVLDQRDEVTMQTRLVGWMAQTFLPRAYREMIGMSRIITESGLDWTIVRFIAPKNGPATGIVRAGFFGKDKIGWGITRGDIAAFTTDQISSPQYSRAAPAVSN